MKKYVVGFRFELLKEEIGIPLEELPGLFKLYFGISLSRAAVFFWFSRHSIPLDRLSQLLTLVRLHTHRRLDIWRYIDVPDPLPNEKLDDEEAA